MDIAITAAIIIVLMLVMKFFMQKRAQKAHGKLINISLFNDEIQNLLNGDKSILYFYTPTCSACKPQAVIIDKLKNDIRLVGKVDLSENQNAVAEFGILGTPTIVIMKGNIVGKIFVGLKKYDFLKTEFEAV